MTRALLIAVVAQGFAFGVVRAQNGCPTPGPHEDIVGDHVADAMRSYASWHPRLGLDIPVRDSSVTTAITDAAVCNAIYRGIYNNIASMIGPPAGTDVTTVLSKYAIHYFRVGDYYAAMLIPKPNGVLAQVNGWADVMIFSRKTLQFIGVVRA